MLVQVKQLGETSHLIEALLYDLPENLDLFLLPPQELFMTVLYPPPQ